MSGDLLHILEEEDAADGDGSGGDTLSGQLLLMGFSQVHILQVFLSKKYFSIAFSDILKYNHSERKKYEFNSTIDRF